MDLKYNVFGKSMYSLKEMELIQLASQWFYDAGRLPSSAWAQVTYGDVAVDSIRKILSNQSEPYYFGGVDKIFPPYIHAIRSAVEMYNDFCRHAPPYFFNKTSDEEIEKVMNISANFGIELKKEYFTRFTMLEEILDKIKDDIDFFENNSKRME
ncbi:hypothetical protein AB1I62_00555 [Enterococcus sp. AN402]|uniref:hypothetical protein n=1 Tax=Enterococcus sp. AN402 TaxID=3151386 RepID=UPI003459E1D5